MKNRFQILATAILAAVLALFTALPARAQFNTYGETRTILLAPPTHTLGTGNNTVSNAPVDIHGFDGIGSIILTACTNAPGGTVTATLLGSDDLVTFSALQNYSLASQSSIIYSNLYYGTNGLTATNTTLLPGAITTPTAATAGFAGAYLNAAANPFTNSGAINMVAGAKNVYLVGFNVGDAKRYLQVQWAFGGTVTNAHTSATLIARKAGFP